MKLSEETARSILEAFGPNSDQYNCMSPADVIEAALPFRTISGFVKDEMKGSDTHNDYGADIRASGGADYKAERREFKAEQREQRERLREAGFLK